MKWLLFFLLISLQAHAQTGAISGVVTDEKREPMIGAVIQIEQGGIVRGGAPTDIDGLYEVKPLQPGMYTVRVRYAGYKQVIKDSMTIMKDSITRADFNMQPLQPWKTADTVFIAYHDSMNIAGPGYHVKKGKYELMGKVLDPDLDPLRRVRVDVYQNGVLVKSTRTNYEGKYRFRLKQPGQIDIVLKKKTPGYYERNNNFFPVYILKDVPLNDRALYIRSQVPLYTPHWIIISRD